MEIRTSRLRSRYFGDERRVAVLLPPSYTTTRRRYPVLYLHDGTRDWLGRGRLRPLLAGAWEREELREFLIVMPEPVERTKEYKLSKPHLEFVARELVPWTDAHWRTRPRPEARAVHGVSLGGLVAVWLGLKHPDLFGAAGGQGGAYWYARQRVVREVLKMRNAPPTRFFLACGIHDGNLPDNRDLAQALEIRDMSFRYEEVSGRHSWNCWRGNLTTALAYYFG